MKGIRKLFYGFVLLALFCVGFKIEAKAALAVTRNTPTQSASIDYTTSTGDTAVTAKMDYSWAAAGDTFPTNAGYRTFRLRLNTSDTDGDSTALGTPLFVCFKTDTDGTTHYIGTGGTAAAALAAATGTPAGDSGTLSDAQSTVTATKSEVSAKLTNAALTIKLHVAMVAEEGTPDAPATATVAGASATGLTVTKHITSSLNNGPASGVTVTPASVYLLPGQGQTFTLNVTSQEYNKKLNNWILDPESIIEDVSKSTSLPVISQAIKAKAGAATDGTVKADYVAGGLDLTMPTTALKPGDSVSRDFSFTGYTTDDIYSVKVGDAALTYTLTELNAAKTTGKFNFTVPSLSNNTHHIYIQMKDGNTFDRTITVNDTTEVAIRSDGVAVTVGKNANISQFLTSGATRNGTVTVSGDADDYADISPSSGSNAVGSFKLVGVSAMKESKKNKITITPTGGTAVEGRVTVYPKVSITTNSSGSSDSLNSGTSSSSKETPLKVTVPAYVYYDNTGYKVSKAQIHFEGSDGTKTRSLDAPDSVSGTSWTVSVDSMKLSSILKDVCDGSSDEVKVKVWPYKGDDPDKTEGIGASTEIKAYKISLDGSGGAKYTINGEDVGDYFYAVKGTRYTIKATPKVAGDKFKNWDNNAFSSESGGDFTASESRTFKAVYDSGSSSSSSSSGRSTATNGESTGSGDYDDVPKTGESKTDIWILWSVLMISILGAGFMIWKRFGLARAIAEAEEQVAVAEREEQVKAEKKAKKDKLDMLKDLRNL